MTDAHPVADASGPPGAHGPRDASDPSAPPPPSGPLRRSREHKVVGGVCGGLGRYCDMDPVIFRVALSVLAVAGGLGLIAYGFCWLLIPLYGEEENEGRRLLSGRVEGTALTAVLCALIGCGLFLSMLNNGNVVTFSLMLSLATVGAGYWSLHRRQAESGTGAVDAATAQAVADAPPETLAPPPPGGGPSWWRDPIVKDGTTGHVGTGYLWGPDDGTETPAAAPATEAPRLRYGPPDRERVPTPARPPRERVPIGGWTFLTALLAAAAGIGATWGERPLGTTLEIGLAAALGVFGLGLLVSTRYGRTGAGTLVSAVLTCVLLAGAAALPKSVTTDWTRRTWAPTSAAAASRAPYELGTGVGTLRLTGLGLREGQTAAVTAEVGAGRLAVVVPPDVTVELEVEVGLGDISLPEDTEGDIDVAPGEEARVTLKPADGREPRGTLELDLKVGLGQVEVDRA
ncbi:PspC domain-containing protein [Streptomyces sp. LX-29]|uniref:PspC domain-containing protein n=1 Tax=Streptomyces sp. LX-29 TaxID=2900152 RepID=UPI00240DC3FE|nr:PspC domain-containing protein [Streptomyces sp. LX-29]WFB08920.1 PspC domain-containing protein [Streptomyces sp. LX-29]